MQAMSTATISAPDRLSRRLAAIPSVDIALLAGGRVADLGCGAGESTIAIALSYPEALVDGFEADAAVIETARVNARAARVTGRVTFRHAHATSLRPGDLPAYDVVIAPSHLRDAATRLLGERGEVVSLDDQEGAA